MSRLLAVVLTGLAVVACVGPASQPQILEDKSACLAVDCKGSPYKTWISATR
jgi:hypothetical protein